ncbi:hypothetical protein WA1_08545 [Scytonema hofmannii PCC 7110]|uniref:Uncharacterized protein n=2 Tax=Scytonema hofmannii TaxID=34078 RepID=A0A139WS17_9CYAN|nr:hypothetical protein WA1_08545 [Scytonema hofmannii PCC 7110]
MVSTFLLASCNQTESTQAQCQRFTQVMQTVVDETQTVKQNSKFDKEALSQFIKVTEKSADQIINQSTFNDQSLVNFQNQFFNLYDSYTSAGSNLIKPNKIATNPQSGYNSLDKIKQSIIEEKKILISFNKYCNS